MAPGVECAHHDYLSGTGSEYFSIAAAVDGPRSGPDRFDRRLPRVRDVPDAGRGDAPLDPAPGVSRQHLLGDRGLQHHARAVAGLLAARSDSARILVPGWRVAALLDREPQRPWGDLRADAGPRDLAQRAPDAARYLLAIHGEAADVLDVRGHADPDRSRLYVPVPARVHVVPNAGRRVCRDPGRVLDGLRDVSAAGTGLQLPGRRRALRLAAPLHRLPRALQQELEPLVGVRHLVPEPVPARVAVPLQRRRLVDAQFHPDAGDDDARHVVGRVAEDVALAGGEVPRPRDERRRADAG